jgi:hypothetical protein
MTQQVLYLLLAFLFQNKYYIRCLLCLCYTKNEKKKKRKEALRSFFYNFIRLEKYKRNPEN